VALSNNSFSLLTTTAGRMSQTSSLQQDRSSTGVSGSALQQLRSQEPDASGILAAANIQSCSGSGGSGIPALVEQEEAGSGAEVLEELLLKHVDNELDLITVSKLSTVCSCEQQLRSTVAAKQSACTYHHLLCPAIAASLHIPCAVLRHHDSAFNATYSMQGCCVAITAKV